MLTCGFQIAEAVVLHQQVPMQEARVRAVEMLQLVGIPAPEQRIDEYPHQLSGGMRQRVMIAMALSCNPDVLIADEPTTALDVTIQAQILALLESLQESLQMAIVMITHDLGVIAETADQVAVMYAGQIVEYAETQALFTRPRHPYTRGLLRSIPRLDDEQERLDIIPGVVPDARAFPQGCRFAPRCPLADDHCRAEAPSLAEVEAGHWDKLLEGRGRMSEAAPLIEVEGLKKHFPVRRGFWGRVQAHVKAVDGVDLAIGRGETLGVVGESGCGKTTLGRLMLRLIEATAGQVRFAGVDLLELGKEAMRQQRRDMQIIFQDPYASLNPRMTVGGIIGEALKVQRAGRAHRVGRASGGTAGDGRVAGGLRTALPARVFRRPAPAHWHCPRLGGAAAVHRRRRTRVGTGRFGAGPDYQLAARPTARFGSNIYVYCPRLERGAPHFGSGGRDVLGARSRSGGARSALPPAVPSLYARRCWRPCPGARSAD